MFQFLIGNILFSFVGRAYLYLRYRDRETINKIKEEKYAGHFSHAGRVVMLNIVAGLFGLMIIAGLIGAIIGIFRNGISDP